MMGWARAPEEMHAPLSLVEFEEEDREPLVLVDVNEDVHAP